MQKVTADAILREIYDSRYEVFADLMAHNGWNLVEYDFTKFRADMLRRELLSDIKTIKTKWDMLAAQGVIKPYGKRIYDKAELNLWAFAPFMSPQAQALLIETGKAPVGRRTAEVA